MLDSRHHAPKIDRRLDCSIVCLQAPPPLGLVSPQSRQRSGIGAIAGRVVPQSLSQFKYSRNRQEAKKVSLIIGVHQLEKQETFFGLGAKKDIQWFMGLK